VTDVGKIKLGVEINANDLSAKLGEAVRKAIAPALAEIQAELNKIQKEYDDTGKAAEKSDAVQVAGAKAVADSLDKVQRKQAETAAASDLAGAATKRQSSSNDALSSSTRKVTDAQNQLNAAIDIFGRKSPQAEAAQKRLTTAQTQHTEKLIAAAAESRASTDSQIEDYERLARAAEESAVKQRVANKAASSDRGGGGGFLHALVGAPALNAYALASQSLPAIATAVVGLSGAIVQLGQAALVLPGVYAALGASAGVAFLGVHGLKDAITALNKAAAPDASAADLKKVTDSMRDMDPAAQAVAKSISAIMQGPLKDLEKTVQGKMFAGFSTDLDNLSNKVFPKLKTNIGGIADAWNGTLKQLTGQLGDNRNLSLIDRLLGNTADGQKRANAAIAPILHAITTLASTGGEFIPRLGDALAKVADRFDNFVSTAGKTGQLWKWIDEGLNGLRALGDSVLNVGKTITGLTKSAGGDEGFLGWLQRATQRMSDFVNSASGQQKLTDFFAMGKQSLHEWGDLFKALGPDLAAILKGFAAWGAVTLPIVTAIAELVQLLNKIPGLITSIVAGFLAFKTIGGILGKFGVGGAGGAVAGSAGSGGISAFGGGALNRSLLGLSIAGAGSAAQQGGGTNPVAQGLGGLATIGGSALTGAAIGSILPGPGTAIGAIAGAGIGAAIAGYNAAMGKANEEDRQAIENNEKLAAAARESAAAYDATAQAVKTAGDALLASKGVIDGSTLGAVGDQISALGDTLKSSLGPDTARQVNDVFKGLNLTTDQLSSIVTGSQADFDALAARLQNIGGPGAQEALSGLTKIRDATLGAAHAAADAAPALGKVADALTGGDLPLAAAKIGNAFAAIPHDIPLTTSIKGEDAVFQVLSKITDGINVNKDGVVTITEQGYEQVEPLLADLHIKLSRDALTGQVTVTTDQTSFDYAAGQLGTLKTLFDNLKIGGGTVVAPPVGPPLPPSGTGPLPGGHYMGGIVRRGYADGGTAQGVMPGYSPGVDNMMVPLSGGEGIVIPEAMRALGPDWLYGINSHYRSGLSKAGYAGGGLVGGFADGGIPEDASTIGLLTQIRDLLAGKNGGSQSPLATTAASTRKMASAAGGKPGQTGNWGQDFLTGFLGYFGITTPWAGGGGAGGVSGAGGAPAFNASSFAGPLSQFARTGNLTPELAGLGLDPNDQIIKAITTARDKKKGGLGGDEIANLVQQVLGGGGYTGQIDSSNSSLLAALQAFQAKGGPQVGIPSPTGRRPAGSGGPGLGAAAFGGFAGPGNIGNAAALDAFAQAAHGGKYAAASDLTNGLADCSGAVSDLVEFLTKGQASSERLFSTGNEASVLQGLGAVPGLVPGSLQIGVSPTHTAATLPNGVNFESGGSGGGVVYGGPVGAGDKQFTQQFSLPTDATGAFLPGGMPGLSPASFGAGGGRGLGGGGGTVPVYVTNFPGGGAPGIGAPPGTTGGSTPPIGANLPPGVGQIASAGLTSAGGVASNLAGDIIPAIGSSIVPAFSGRQPTPTAATVSTFKLLNQGNPLGLATAAGLNVPDFTRDGTNNDFAAPSGAAFDASGRLFSRTADLGDRTSTDTTAAVDAMRAQLVSVTGQVVTNLSDKVLTPVVQAGVTSGFSAVNASVFGQQGAAIGQAAGPPIADAVANSVATATASNAGGGGGGGDGNIGTTVTDLATNFGLTAATGGLVSGGTPGVDSVPILAQQDEWIFNVDQVNKMGGPAGMGKFAAALTSGKIMRFASGGGVGNQGSGPAAGTTDATVGADFFGVSQIPIIGTIVNLIISVLLKVIGVNIASLNTLQDIGTDFKSFRGDFKAFDAAGRLNNDTSGLTDRSDTSTDEAAQQRINILKIVLDALIKFIIDKIIVPLLQAVGQAAVSALGSAVSSGISGASFGAGGAGGAAASSFIDALGDASIQIAAQVGTDIANAITDVLLDDIASALVSSAPQLVSALFGGGLLEGIIGPIGSLFTTIIGGLLGAITALFGGAFGGVSTLIPGLPFDDGGMAHGIGYLPKATMDDELVLSPGQTDIFSKFVGALQNGGFNGGSRTVHAPITVMQAGPETAENVQSRLLSHMP
jgi:hypothetical protein